MIIFNNKIIEYNNENWECRPVLDASLVPDYVCGREVDEEYRGVVWTTEGIALKFTDNKCVYAKGNSLHESSMLVMYEALVYIGQGDRRSIEIDERVMVLASGKWSIFFTPSAYSPISPYVYEPKKLYLGENIKDGYIGAIYHMGCKGLKYSTNQCVIAKPIKNSDNLYEFIEMDISNIKDVKELRVIGYK